MVTKELDQYTVDCTLLLKNVTVEDAGKYKVTARNDLGESNATISLNFDSKSNDLAQPQPCELPTHIYLQAPFLKFGTKFSL